MMAMMAAIVWVEPGCERSEAAETGAPRAPSFGTVPRAGPVTFNEIIIRNPPNAGDIKDAQTKDPGDNCHPKFSVGVSNDGKEKMAFRVVVSLEDDAGTVYFKCDREDTVDPGAENDHTNMCLLTSMKTIDWPKLTVVRIRADVDPDK